MDAIAQRIAQGLVEAPAWARAALAAHDSLIRERAADVIASVVARRLGEPVEPLPDRNQMALPL
jgi:hypothetical protein